jgi:fused signal recognition particle receptor
VFETVLNFAIPGIFGLIILFLTLKNMAADKRQRNADLARDAEVKQRRRAQATLDARARAAARAAYPDHWDMRRLNEERFWPDIGHYETLLEVPAVIVTYDGQYDDGGSQQKKVKLWTLEQVETAEKDSELSRAIHDSRAYREQQQRERLAAERRAEEKRRQEEQQAEEQRRIQERRQRQLAEQIVVDLKDIEKGSR